MSCPIEESNGRIGCRLIEQSAEHEAKIVAAEAKHRVGVEVIKRTYDNEKKGIKVELKAARERADALLVQVSSLEDKLTKGVAEGELLASLRSRLETCEGEKKKLEGDLELQKQQLDTEIERVKTESDRKIEEIQKQLQSTELNYDSKVTELSKITSEKNRLATEINVQGMDIAMLKLKHSQNVKTLEEEVRTTATLVTTLLEKLAAATRESESLENRLLEDCDASTTRLESEAAKRVEEKVAEITSLKSQISSLTTAKDAAIGQLKIEIGDLKRELTEVREKQKEERTRYSLEKAALQREMANQLQSTEERTILFLATLKTWREAGARRFRAKYGDDLYESEKIIMEQVELYRKLVQERVKEVEKLELEKQQLEIAYTDALKRARMKMRQDNTEALENLRTAQKTELARLQARLQEQRAAMKKSLTERQQATFEGERRLSASLFERERQEFMKQESGLREQIARLRIANDRKNAELREIRASLTAEVSSYRKQVGNLRRALKRATSTSGESVSRLQTELQRVQETLDSTSASLRTKERELDEIEERHRTKFREEFEIAEGRILERYKKALAKVMSDHADQLTSARESFKKQSDRLDDKMDFEQQNHREEVGRLNVKIATLTAKNGSLTSENRKNATEILRLRKLLGEKIRDLDALKKRMRSQSDEMTTLRTKSAETVARLREEIAQVTNDLEIVNETMLENTQKFETQKRQLIDEARQAKAEVRRLSGVEGRDPSVDLQRIRGELQSKVRTLELHNAELQKNMTDAAAIGNQQLEKLNQQIAGQASSLKNKDDALRAADERRMALTTDISELRVEFSSLSRTNEELVNKLDRQKKLLHAETGRRLHLDSKYKREIAQFEFAKEELVSEHQQEMNVLQSSLQERVDKATQLKDQLINIQRASFDTQLKEKDEQIEELKLRFVTTGRTTFSLRSEIDRLSGELKISMAEKIRLDEEAIALRKRIGEMGPTHARYEELIRDAKAKEIELVQHNDRFRAQLDELRTTVGKKDREIQGIMVRLAEAELASEMARATRKRTRGLFESVGRMGGPKIRKLDPRFPAGPVAPREPIPSGPGIQSPGQSSEAFYSGWSPLPSDVPFDPGIKYGGPVMPPIDPSMFVPAGYST